MTEVTLTTVSRSRQIAFYTIVILLSLLLIAFTGFVIPILPSIIIGWFNPDLFGIHQLHEMAAATLTWLMLAGMLLQLHHPERKVAAMQMANLVILISIVITLVTGTFMSTTLIFLAFTLTAAILHPNRQEMLRFGRPIIPELLALVVVAAVPVIVYALNQLNIQQIAVDSHAEIGHYGTMALVVITALFVGLLASLKTIGWRIPAWGAGFVAIVFGLLSVVYPEQSSSVGTLWGAFAAVWGLAFIGVAEYKRLKERDG